MSLLIAYGLFLINVALAFDGDACNYVRIDYDEYPDAQGVAQIIDFCRTIKTSGNDPEYRKYVCNEDEIYDQVFADSNCTGDVISVETVSYSEHACGNIVGECEYIVLRTPCTSTSTDEYSILGLLADDCVAHPLYPTALGGLNWFCDPYERVDYVAAEDGACPNWAASSHDIEKDVCISTDYEDEEWEPVYSACLTKQFTANQFTWNPTSDPTLEPTYNPTGDPTVNPTTMAPTDETDSPTMNEMTTTAEIDSIDTSVTINVNIITNCIFLAFTVLFLSFF